MGAFVNYRRHVEPAALRLANGCGSALAALAREQADTTPLTPQRLESLRKAVATGVDDAYVILEQVTHRVAATDTQYLFCKYALLNRYRNAVPIDALREAAARCYDSVASQGSSAATGSAATLSARRDQVVAGIANFVPAERAALDALRTSSHFHYGWSVPYLPFAQAEVDLFEPLISAAQGASAATSALTASTRH